MDGNNIGERIKILRECRGLTQSELAKALNVKRETVTHWEKGTRDLKTESTIALASFFGVSCDELLTGNKPEHACQTSELGLSSESIERLIYLKKLNDYKFSNGLTIGEIAKNAALYEKIPKGEWENFSSSSFAMPYDANALHALNAIMESDDFIYLFYNLYNFLFLQEIKYISISSDGKSVTYPLDERNFYDIELVDDYGNFVPIYTGQSREIILANINNSLYRIARNVSVDRKGISNKQTKE